MTTTFDGAARDVYSQSGEDGVLAAILDRLPEPTGWCVEFGAWDGVFLSNTRNLVQQRGFHAVLIEGDAERYRDLLTLAADDDRVHPMCAFVGFHEDDGLDTLLATTAIPSEFDVLSIDIDGNDYHVWQASTRYRPRIVVIEYNPTIPNEVRFVQPRDPRMTQGSSASALVELAARKGYELAAVTRLNLVFVRDDLFRHLGIDDNRLSTLRTDYSHVTYLFQGYDGTVFLRGARRLLWHDIPLDERRVQHLPAWLRRYPGSYGRVRALCLRLMAALRRRRGDPDRT